MSKLKYFNLSQSKLPDEHVPESLRGLKPEKRLEVMYGIRIGHKPGSYGMIHGPTPDLYKMLNTVPEGRVELDHLRALKVFIVRFNKDGSEELLYVWDNSNSKWVRVVHKINEQLKEGE